MGDAAGGGAGGGDEGNVCAVCSAPAPHRCAGCAMVHYCCRDHQRLDWKAHKGRCCPFKVGHDAVVGRFLEATRDLRPGERVLREEPLVAGPSQVTPPVCLGCLEPLRSAAAAVPCERCGWPMCGAPCARRPEHRPECDAVALWRGDKVAIRNLEAAAHPMYECVLALRVLWAREAAPQRWAKLQALESHCELRRGSAKWERDLSTVVHTVRRFFKAEGRFTDDEVMRVCGIIQVNGHEVPLVEPAYVALYERASMLEHSCRPNCFKSFTESGALTVHAAMPVRRGDHLSICYTDALWGTANRRHHLHETKFFWCRCLRCCDPTEYGTCFSGLRCLSEACGGCVVAERPVAAPGSTPEEEEDLDAMSWTCRSCGRLLASREVFAVLEEVGSALASLQKGDVGACERFLRRWGGGGGPLAPNHFYLTDARLALEQLYGQGPGGLAATSDAQLAAKGALCRQLLGLVDVLVPAEHRLRGLLQFDLHAVLAEEARRLGLAAQLDSGSVHERLIESRRLLEGALELLRHEPAVLPEGQMALQAARNLRDLDVLLRGLHAALGGASPL